MTKRWHGRGSRMAAFALAVLVCVPGTARRNANASGQLRLLPGRETADIYVGDRQVLEYVCLESPRKPYVSKLFSPAGAQVLRDSPSDHKHHHALMFALSADKVNFWEERDSDAGMEKPTSVVRAWQADRKGIRGDGLIQELEWLDMRSRKALLNERRTIAVLKGADIPATLVMWRSRLQAAAGRDSTELGGEHFFGLGMRFVTSMDKNGRFFNSEGAAGETVRGTERLTAARWAAYSATADERPVTVALFDHPANLRHPARMFTMSSPFAYLAATLNLWKEPLSLQAGKPLELTYGVALWDGHADPKQVNALFLKWLEFSTE